jgi:hypothetical protein
MDSDILRRNVDGRHRRALLLPSLHRSYLPEGNIRSTVLARKPTHCPIHDSLFEALESQVAELHAASFCQKDSGEDSITIIRRATQKVVQARTLLNDHVSGCSRCARWLM